MSTLDILKALWVQTPGTPGRWGRKAQPGPGGTGWERTGTLQRDSLQPGKFAWEMETSLTFLTKDTARGPVRSTEPATVCERQLTRAASHWHVGCSVTLSSLEVANSTGGHVLLRVSRSTAEF